MRHQATLFEQIIQSFPWQRFEHHVRAHRADERQRGFTSRQQFMALLAGALAGQQGLRPLVATLAPNSGALRLLGGRAPARSTLADALRSRPAALFVDLLGDLISHAQRPTRRVLREAVRLIDATYLNLGKRMRRWLGFHNAQVAAKLHVVFDPAAERPTFFALSQARLNDNTAAKCLLPIEPGATYVFDRGYYDFGWWRRLAAAGCHFVTRLRTNTPLQARNVRAHGGEGREHESGVLADETAFLPKRLAGSRRNPFPHQGRVVTIRSNTGKVLRLFTNDLNSPAETIAALYKERWQIELFFKWIKQNLRITRFAGTCENAVRTQIAVSLIAYLLVRLTQTKQNTPQPASHILLIARTHLFVRRPLASLLNPTPPQAAKPTAPPGQLHLDLCS